MNFNKFTIKSQEAVQNAQEIARTTAIRLLNRNICWPQLVQDGEGVVVPILHKGRCEYKLFEN